MERKAYQKEKQKAQAKKKEGQEEVGTLWSGFEEMSYAVLRNLSLELSV